MSQGTYFHLQLAQVPAEQESQLSEFCFTWQATGVAQDLNFQQPELEYNPQVLEADKIKLSAFFADHPPEQFFSQLQSQFPGVQFQIDEEKNRDWLAEWKKGFQPFALVDDIWIVPSWCEIPSATRHPIFIDPGMAFGTGTHATTQLAARLLIQIQNAKSVLDVGTGTGILAMLMKIKGVPKIVATEIDPIARETARENVARNNALSIDILDSQVDAIAEMFDVVVANIVDGVLLKIKDDLIRNCGHNLILSGILEEREASFIREFLKDTDFKIHRRLVQDEWVGLWLVRGANAPLLG